MTFDLSSSESRQEFLKVVASNPDALSFVADLATKVGVYRAYDVNSPGLFVQRNDREEGGTIVGICGGHRFLVNDGDLPWMVWQWQRLYACDLVESAKAKRALALLVIADEAREHYTSDTVVLQNDSCANGPGIATNKILRAFFLQEENGRVQAALDACYETIHAARKELGLSLRESPHIPAAIRALKIRLKRAKSESSSPA